MNISEHELWNQAHAFSQRHPGVTHVIETKYGLPKRILYALGSRETNLAEFYEQHPGDGGHGRGTWQLDDRSHHIPNPFPIELQAEMAGKLLHDLIAEFGGNVKSALSAYNAGAGGARKGIAAGDSDRFTTGHDYGADVLARLHVLQSKP
jgi:hypothetical protein